MDETVEFVNRLVFSKAKEAYSVNPEVLHSDWSTVNQQ